MQAIRGVFVTPNTPELPHIQISTCLMNYEILCYLKYEIPIFPAYYIILTSIKRVSVSRDSSVGIATRYRLGGPGIESWWRWDFPDPSGLSLGPTLPPTQWIPCHSRSLPGRDVDHPPHLVPRLKKEYSVSLLPVCAFVRLLLKLFSLRMATFLVVEICRRHILVLLNASSIFMCRLWFIHFSNQNTLPYPVT